jgi:hypothetical protein
LDDLSYLTRDTVSTSGEPFCDTLYRTARPAAGSPKVPQKDTPEGRGDSVR